MKVIIDINKLLEHIRELQEAGCSLSADELIAISEPYGFSPLTDECKPDEASDFFGRVGNAVFIGVHDGDGINERMPKGEAFTSIDYLIRHDAVWMPIPGGE